MRFRHCVCFGRRRTPKPRLHRTAEWIRQECDFVILFTGEGTAGFYERLGLRRQSEHTETIPWPPHDGSAPRITRLDLTRDHDFAVVEGLAREREAVSRRLGFLNSNLLLFKFLYEYAGRSFYLEELDAVIVVEETADHVRIHDIVARTMPDRVYLAAVPAHFGKDVELLFCTDRLGAEGAVERRVDDSVLMVSDDFDLSGVFVFPYSMRA